MLAMIDGWFEALEPEPLSAVVTDPGATAVFSADLVRGFCDHGPLASERIGALARPVADLFARAHERGVRTFVLVQDTHDERTPEFASFPPHCVRGTDESRTIDALAALPFADTFMVIEKNSLHPAVATGFDTLLDDHAPGLRTAIVVGDCTDLCTYHLAMHLRLRANARNLAGSEVVVPADLVDTYDQPPGGPGIAHDGDFFHRVFLYHMALNGIRVVRSLP